MYNWEHQKPEYMHHKRPLQIGITGGIGSGKSTVAKIFSVLGVPVYESDDEARKCYFDPEVKQMVLALLGPEAYISDYQINKGWIAGQVFAQPILREKLNEILHPAVAAHYQKWLEHQIHPYVLKVAALLFEAQINRSLDQTILVSSPLPLRTVRIQKRDPQRTEAEINNIISSQMSDTEKRKLANGIIQNDEKHSLIMQVMEWDEKFKGC